ncbi:MAG: SGNH/GDSL hydrolase family protein [Geitlerinemataceae cyanobacterium]
MNVHRPKISLLCFGLLVGIFPASASAVSFDSVVVFGDSLSDSGNVFLATGGEPQTVPFGGLIPSRAYESGRFSDGPVWTEIFAANLGLSASPFLAGGTNFAFGGAQTGPLGSLPPASPSLLDQLAFFQDATAGVAPSDALYVVFGGNNDARIAALQRLAGDDAGADNTIAQGVNNLATIISTLAASGAENFLVPNIGNLGVTPAATRGPAIAPGIFTDVATEFNILLDGALGGLATNPDINLVPVDTFGFLSSISASPESFGLTNGSDPCIDLTTVCTNPNEFVFYDGIHVTTATHTAFAQLAGDRLNAAHVPEPSTLLGSGVLTLFVLARKRREFKARKKL